MSRLLWVLGISLSVSFLCSILEAVFLSVTHSWVGVLQDRGERAGFVMKRLLGKIDEPIAAILTLNTIAHTVGAAMGGAIALEVFGDEWIALFSIGLTLAILLLSEIIPKTLGATYWKALSIPTAYVLSFLVVVFKPVLVPLSWFNRLIQPRGAKEASVSRAEIQVLAEIGRREGVLREDEWSVVSNVMELGRVEVREVMTPRTDIVAVSFDASVNETMDLVLASGHMRLPVYDGSLDEIVGILRARDLWAAHREGLEQIQEVVRPVPFVPEGKAVRDLINELRDQQIHLAMVVDEFGGTAGLVTLEDLIEEIVGEIRDEHEALEPEEFRKLEGGGAQVRGDVLIREMNDVLGLQLPDDEADTVGGFVFGRLGRVGRVGDEVELDGGLLRVTRVKGRRIERVLFVPDPSGQEPSGGEP
jgi:putative hemolysin